MNPNINITINGYESKWNINHAILTPGDSNIKINKSEKFNGGEFSTMILHLSPNTISGFNTCPYATAGCKAICLNKAGQGGMFQYGVLHSSSCHVARVGRTTLLMRYRNLFFKKLKLELYTFLLKCEIKGSKPCIRLNGTSDLNWVKITDPETRKNLFELFPMIQFYDYTKNINILKNLPKNYHVTFSRSESNYLQVTKALSMGHNVAVVFAKKMKLHETYMGYPVFNGDQTDLRFLDNVIANKKAPIIIGLVEKGYLAKHDKTGFVVREIQQEIKAVA